jgi:hypothetical protein
MLNVQCSECKKVSELSLQTQPSPFENVVEVFLECPFCGSRIRNHFLSVELIQKQLELRHAVTQWNKHNTRLNYNRLVKERQAYSTLFDSEQEKYRSMLEALSSLEKAVAEHGAES